MRLATRAIKVWFWILFAGTAAANPVLDQQHAPIGNFPALTVANDRTQIQTFTVGISGLLARIDVNIWRQPQAVEEVDLSVWSTDPFTGLPKSLLATRSVLPIFPTGTSQAFITFELETAISVSAGVLLSILLDSDAPNIPPNFPERYLWQNGGQYDRGRGFTRVGGILFEVQDFHFRTFVIPSVNVNTELSALVKPGTSVFNRQPVPGGPAGTFSFTAKFCNSGQQRLNVLRTVTVTLSGGNILLNRDSLTPPGVGSELTIPAAGNYADLTLTGGECVEVTYLIGLAQWAPFEFFVNVFSVIY
jgi:hypothetical protein